MLYKYRSEEFRSLKDKINIYLDYYATTSECTDKQQEIINIFNFVLNESNIGKIHSLDDQDLKFNKWGTVNEAINNHLLSYQNSVLYRFHNDMNSNSFTFNEIVNSLYLVLYADMYEFSLITKDENLRNFFVEYTEKLVFIVNPK
ncbi:hypothetical protein [Psychrobacter communis]|uniref:Uncharacterized protein n=1 Tax=Psychrobacter communis TaxID=2762238 RepID=A0ABR8RI05_9GAMM|nr:hypothetical protein [Psychrobacter communis]MBD7947416.1 hypothetical protein [Psychrobacter communis]